MAKKPVANLSETVRLRVRALRAARAMTQESLCEGAGLSLDSVSRIENGTRVPTLDTVQKLAAGPGVSVASIIGDASAPPLRFSPTTLRIARRLDKQPEPVRVTAEKLLAVFLAHSTDG